MCNSNIFPLLFKPQMGFCYQELAYFFMAYRFGADPLLVGLAEWREHRSWEMKWVKFGAPSAHYFTLPLQDFSEREVDFHCWCPLLCSRSGKLYLFFLHEKFEYLKYVVFNFEKDRLLIIYFGNNARFDFYFRRDKRSETVSCRNKSVLKLFWKVSTISIQMVEEKIVKIKRWYWRAS